MRWTWLATILLLSVSVLPLSAQVTRKARTLAKMATAKEVDAFTSKRFTRQSDEAFRALSRKLSDEATQPERLHFYVQAGNWNGVAAILVELDEDAARKIHFKVMSDLAGAYPKSTILPLDAIRLADAAPDELDDKQIAQVGRLLQQAMKDVDTRAELVALLQRGTARLGGNDPQRRQAAARVLAAAELWAEAKLFGLTDRDVQANQQATAATEATPTTKRSWDQVIMALRNATLDEATRALALDELHELLLQATPNENEQRLLSVMRDPQQRALTESLVTLIGQKTAAAFAQVDYVARGVNLEIQTSAMRALPGGVKLTDEPWQTLANLYANSWHQEAQNSIKVYPTWQKSTAREKYPHVSLELLIRVAPQAEWSAALLPQLATMVKVAQARLMLLSDNSDRVIPQLRELIRTDAPTAAKLANQYLENWARRHDPNLSPDVLRQYKSDSQTVVLTRSEQESSLKQLGHLLSQLDAPTRALLDEVQLVRAFDFCHSRAETYTRPQVVQVFGPLEDIAPTLMFTLFDRMRTKLASQWRELSVQRDAATRRTSSDVFQLVDEGYAEASRIALQWLKAHPDDWRMGCTVGSLLSDWAEFAYFQRVASSDDDDRFATYLKHTDEALAQFRAAAQAYAARVPKLKRGEFELLPYRTWFYGLLGITHDGGVNLRKGVPREGLEELRKAMLSLSGGAAEAHLELFSSMVADNVSANRIAPEMKYRYLSSAVQVTGRRPTVYPAEEKIQYYDSLLQEIRLQARLDGSPRIHAPGEFGVFVSLVHTADVARESGGFGKYVMNEVQRTVSGRTITEKPLYRDRFEEALRVALGDFFTIRAIRFADPNAGARVIASPLGADESDSAALRKLASAAWQETPLAYLLLATKDTTVDRVPELELELDFFDREGKVVIPVASHPLLIELTPDASRERPASEIALTQIVDSRELVEGRLKIDVVATAHGLVPELSQLIDLGSYALPVQDVAEKEGLLLRELRSNAEGMYPVSERSWTVHVDPQRLLRGAHERVEFEFPRVKQESIATTYRRYQDLDPVEAAATVTLFEGADAAKVAQSDYITPVLVGLAVLALCSLGWFITRKKPAAVDEAASPFVMPSDVTAFAVLTLLHRIDLSRRESLTTEQKRHLRLDIRAIETNAFSRQGEGDEARQDLEGVARRWLRVVAPSAARA